MTTDTARYMLRIGRRDAALDARAALQDLRESAGRLNLAAALAAHDVTARYRGSLLGPLWITLSMGATTLGVGVLYAQLFHMEAAAFLPFVALGLILFSFVATTINEGCETFIQARALLSQTRLPMFTFVWRTLLRNLVNLAHHAGIAVAALAWSDGLAQVRPLAAAAGLGLVVLNAGWMSLAAAVVAARFRDVPQIIAAVLQLCMLLTPIFWRPDRLGENHLLLAVNPFRHMVEAVRAPLLGGAAPDSLAVLAVMGVLGWIGGFCLFARARRDLVHYL